MNWNINRAFSLFAYGDYAYFAWPKYGQSFAGAHALDGFLQLNYQHKKTLLTAQYRTRYRQRDNKEKDMLINRNEHRGRIKADYVLSQSILRHYKCIIVSASLGYFHTQDYSSRVYTYERGMLYDFSFPCFFGHGIRYSMTARSDLGEHLTLLVKAGTTDYFDRCVIGSGLQEIAHSSQTDIQLQAIVKL